MKIIATLKSVNALVMEALNDGNTDVSISEILNYLDPSIFGREHMVTIYDEAANFFALEIMVPGKESEIVDVALNMIDSVRWM